MSDIVFLVEEAPEGGYTANALGQAILTEADTWDELKGAVHEAASCHLETFNGRIILLPLAWYPRLLYATPEERDNWQLLGDSYAIEWPDLDEHIGIEGLLAGRRSGESQQSFERWLNSRKQYGGG
jgi:hypothetical protein